MEGRRGGGAGPRAGETVSGLTGSMPQRRWDIHTRGGMSKRRGSAGATSTRKERRTTQARGGPRRR